MLGRVVNKSSESVLKRRTKEIIYMSSSKIQNCGKLKVVFTLVVIVPWTEKVLGSTHKYYLRSNLKSGDYLLSVNSLHEDHRSLLVAQKGKLLCSFP